MFQRSTTDCERASTATPRAWNAAREIVRLPIDTLLAGESPRLDGQDAAHIARMIEIDGTLPPIIVERSTLRVIDGTHRLIAASLKGETDITVEYYDGPPEDAFLLAVQANVTHGFPLSQADRRSAAARIIVSHPHLSDRAIAVVAGLGAKTIAAIRRRAELGAPVLTARIGRDGRVRPLSGHEGRLRAAEYIRQEPEASLREVARQAGVSPSTAADVRKRLERGEDPVLPSARPRAAEKPPIAPATVLDKLVRDPSLRSNEDGRKLLILLRHCAIGTQEWTDLVGVVPPHAADLVGQLAKHYAQMWTGFAQELGERAHTTV
jgi:ParB-like chromosome segregation protein Spo0J